MLCYNVRCAWKLRLVAAKKRPDLGDLGGMGDWSEQRESNSQPQLGKLMFYH